MRFVLLITALILLSGCAESVPLSNVATIDPVGFWFGLWHGAILPISWLASLFSEDIAIYAIYNTGAGYDTGFILGIAVSIGAKTAANGLFSRFLKKKSEQ